LPEIEKFINIISSFVPIKRGFTHMPHYKLAMHEVEVPPVENFVSIDEYYSALFHELIHSTMKPMDRKISLPQEELVAEIGSSMLCQTFGVLKTLENSIAYCAGWAKKIKEKEVNVVKCAGLAEKAVEFLLNYKEEV
jgi:antirestriction protein ArdC